LAKGVYMAMNLLKEKESVAKLLKKYLVIAEAFDRIGENNFASEYFSKAYIFACKLSAIDSQLHRESMN